MASLHTRRPYEKQSYCWDTGSHPTRQNSTPTTLIAKVSHSTKITTNNTTIPIVHNQVEDEVVDGIKVDAEAVDAAVAVAEEPEPSDPVLEVITTEPTPIFRRRRMALTDPKATIVITIVASLLHPTHIVSRMKTCARPSIHSYSLIHLLYIYN